MSWECPTICDWNTVCDAPCFQARLLARRSAPPSSAEDSVRIAESCPPVPTKEP